MAASRIEAVGLSPTLPLPSHPRGSSWRPARAASRSHLPGCIAYCRVLGSHTKERDLLRCTCDRPGGWTGRLHSPAARTSGRAAIETYPGGPMLGSNGAQVDTRSLRQDPGSRSKDPGSLTRGSCIYPGYRNSDPGAMVAVGAVLCHAVSPWGCDLRNRRCRYVCGVMVRAFRQAKLPIKSATRPFHELSRGPRRCGGGALRIPLMYIFRSNIVL